MVDSFVPVESSDMSLVRGEPDTEWNRVGVCDTITEWAGSVCDEGGCAPVMGGVRKMKGRPRCPAKTAESYLS